MQRRVWILALILQILLAVVAPPIPLGERSLFPGDLWFFVWVPFAFVWLFRTLPQSARAPFMHLISGTGLLIFAIYLHGALRPSMVPAMTAEHISVTDDRFQKGRELVVAIRFLTWIWGGMIVAEWYRFYREDLAKDFKILQRALAAVNALAVASLVLGKLFAPVAQGLGKIYGYNPNAEVWWDRAYGIFRSPVEGSLTLGLSILILLIPGWAPPLAQWSCVLLLVLGILLTKTISCLVAIVISVLLLAWLRQKRELRWIFALLVMTGLGLGLWLISGTELFAQKKGNLFYRVIPWKILGEATASRWDTLLLGTGFNPHYVDNIYLFIFNRGGLIALVVALYAATKSVQRKWFEWNWQQQALVLTLLLTGITLDNLIIRPAAMLLAVAGVSMLQLRKTE